MTMTQLRARLARAMGTPRLDRMRQRLEWTKRNDESKARIRELRARLRGERPAVAARPVTSPPPSPVAPVGGARLAGALAAPTPRTPPPADLTAAARKLGPRHRVEWDAWHRRWTIQGPAPKYGRRKMKS